jgi:endogenous inhibitor of DNA gyrase (YacG/DUF329 family)
MIEKKCEYCGKVMTTGQVKRGNRFCSTKCASLGVYEADVDRDYPWERLPGRM